MIKAILETAAGKVLVIGLSGENMTRLMADPHDYRVLAVDYGESVPVE